MSEDYKRYNLAFLELRGGAPPRMYAHRATLALPGRVYMLYLKLVSSVNIQNPFSALPARIGV